MRYRVQPLLLALLSRIRRYAALPPSLGVALLAVALVASCGVRAQTGAPEYQEVQGAAPQDPNWMPPNAKQIDKPSFQAPAAPGVVPDQVIVALKPGASPISFVSSTGMRSIQDVSVGTRYQVIQLPKGVTVAQAEQTLQNNPSVAGVQANRIYTLDSTVKPDDPYFSQEWAMQANHTDAVDAWGAGIDASNVTVAVCDTGVDWTHPEFSGRLLLGYNFASGSTDVMDHYGHGTHVAGIIGAAGNNGIGVAGVAWNVKIMVVKVLGDDGSGTTTSVMQGIKYAADYGAKVINLSLGTPDTSVDPALGSAIAYANGKGALVVAAAGNDGGDVDSPANDPGAIAVSSTSDFDFFGLFDIEYGSWFSNHGSKVEVSAPGGGIMSTLPLSPNAIGQTGYGKLSGTSMAAPFVTGEAALIFAKHPDWTIQQVRSLIDTAVDHKGSAGRNDKFGFGRINIYKAVQG